MAQPSFTEKCSQNYEEHCCLTRIIVNLVSLFMQMNFSIIQSHVVVLFSQEKKRLRCKKKNSRTCIHVLEEPTDGSNLSLHNKFERRFQL